MPKPTEPLDPGPPRNPVLSIDDFLRCIKNAEGQLRGIQTQVGGLRGIPLNTIFVLLSQELEKLRKETPP